MADLALRQVKKLRKYELEQASLGWLILLVGWFPLIGWLSGDLIGWLVG